MQFIGVAAHAGGADDDAHVIRNVQGVHGLFQGLAVVAFNAAGNAAGGRRVGHQNHVTAGQRDVGGQGGAFVAAFFLVDLNDHFLAFAQVFLHAGLVRVDTGDEIVAGDFLQRQEAVSGAAVIHERCLEGGFQADDTALVDIRFFLFFGWLFDVDVIKLLAIDNRHAQFFSLRGID